MATERERERERLHMWRGRIGGGVQQINFRTEHSCQEMDGEQEGYRGLKKEKNTSKRKREEIKHAFNSHKGLQCCFWKVSRVCV